jgi:hypothetical protein
MQSEQWQSILKLLKFTGFALLVAALPLSNFLMSFASFWLAGVWLLEVLTDIKGGKKLREKFVRFRENRNALLLTSLYLLPIIGLLWTTDFKYATWDLRMKLPILFMPFLLTTLSPITDREFRSLLGIFVLSLSFSVMWCLMIYWHVIPRPYQDVREISVFISHVRFSLLIVLGLSIIWIEAWNKPLGKTFALIMSVFFLYFLYVIASMTGVIVMALIVAWALFKQVKENQISWVRYTSAALLIGLPAIAIGFFYTSYHRYFDVPEMDWNSLEKTSQHGEVYEHTPQYKGVENGHYIWTHIAWQELYLGWAERSAMHPDSLDGRGHTLKGTLIRYMASKGLKKDLEGIHQLTDEDVRAIERGSPVFDENKSNGLSRRLDHIFFELSNYRAGGSPSGHSVFQRLEFWRTAVAIIRENVCFGVGTGDVKRTFAEMYERQQSPLDKEHRLRAHNQYLTMWLTYGFFGFLWFLVVLFWPMKIHFRNTHFIAFLIIALMSFLTEDTLESQAGVTFFAFFFVFFTLKRKISLSTLRPVK